MSSFSRRHGYSGLVAPISMREEAPQALRHAVVQIAAEEGFPTPSSQRALICRVLRVLPDRSNWSEHPNIAGEVETLITTCQWYRVYDIAEAFYADAAASHRTDNATEFESKLNEILYEQGIGWKMDRGHIVYRGDEPFEQAVATARQALVGQPLTPGSHGTTFGGNALGSAVALAALRELGRILPSSIAAAALKRRDLSQVWQDSAVVRLAISDQQSAVRLARLADG